MKPIKLQMKNIGPYLDESIDFTKLDNMFLIKGDTGAGKTFIFDAMTYALYGVLRGNRKGHEESIRSRYVDNFATSDVEFTFEIAKTIYRVKRTLPYDRVNRNGNTTHVSEDVSLEKRGANDFEPIIAGKSEIDKKIEGILGLKADEFARIVVLPQGEFAAFLKQNSNERTKTLKKLFPVDFYTNITEKIKKKADDANLESKNLDNLINSISNGRDFSNARDTIANLKGEIENLEKKSEEFGDEKTKIAQKMTELKNQRAQTEEFNANLRKLNSLEAQKADFERLLIVIQNADKAKTLREYLVSYESAENNLKSNEQKLEIAKKNHFELQNRFNELDTKKDFMKNLSEQNEKDGQELRILREKLAKATEIEKSQRKVVEISQKLSDSNEKIKNLESKISEIKAKFNQKSGQEFLEEINQEIQKLTAENSSLSHEIEDCKKRDSFVSKQKKSEKNLSELNSEKNREEEKLEQNKKVLQELEDAKKKQDEAHSSYMVSAFLVEGKPCPVCGSLEHPNPAKKPEGLLDYSVQIKTYKDNIETGEKFLKNLGEKIAVEETNIKNCKESINSIKTSREIHLVEKEFEENQATLFQKNKENAEISKNISLLNDLTEQKQNAQEFYNSINLELTSEKTKLESLEKELGEGVAELKKKEACLSENLEKNKKEFDFWQKSYNETSKNLSAAETSVKNFADSVKKCSDDFENAKSTLDEKIKDSPFSSREEAKNAYLLDSVLEEKRNAYNKYTADLKSAKDSVESGKNKNLRSLEEIDAEVSQNQQKLLKNQAEFENNQWILREKNAYCTQFEGDFKKTQNAQNQKIELEKTLTPLNKLSENLTGANQRKLPFESWALGLYFDQIVEFAAKRFYDISGGRFKFELKPVEEGQGRGYNGLDLLVFDSYTGKTSDASTLSGGETFEASISLALAITDVVQNNNGGGIQLDSLFIDEGFGTLDPETLEKAMSVLTELGETKMIGMISHVSELENFPGISSSITVIKSNTGSKIKVS